MWPSNRMLKELPRGFWYRAKVETFWTLGNVGIIAFFFFFGGGGMSMAYVFKQDQSLPTFSISRKKMTKLGKFWDIENKETEHHF